MRGVAAEVNHWEDTGIKRLKHGEPSRAKEVYVVLRCDLQVARYYGVEEEVEALVDRGYENVTRKQVRLASTQGNP